MKQDFFPKYQNNFDLNSCQNLGPKCGVIFFKFYFAFTINILAAKLQNCKFLFFLKLGLMKE